MRFLLPIKRHTAIDDAARIRALKVYSKHNQDYAIEFINYIVEKFPFRIHTVRKDRGRNSRFAFIVMWKTWGYHMFTSNRDPHD